MNDPKARQLAYNALSRDAWDRFAGHRERVSALLGAGGGPGPTRVCVLGAGNGNDLDLPSLLRAHREVHLVDIDAGAIGQGAARQGVEHHPGLRLVGGLDLTGTIDAIAGWSPEAPIRADDLNRLAVGVVDRVAPALDGPFDLVASTCLLTQLIGHAFHAVGDRHPHFLPAALATRAGHLRLVARLARPGGTGVLITDVVSSETLPELVDSPESSLPDLLPRLAREGNFFHGVNPAVLPTLFRDDPDLRVRTTALETLPPWRWDFGVRTYLVWALRFRTVDPPR